MSVNSFRDGIVAVDSTTWFGKSWKELDKIHLQSFSSKEHTGFTLLLWTLFDKYKQYISYDVKYDKIHVEHYTPCVATYIDSATSTQPETDDCESTWVSPLNRLVLKTQIQRLWDSYLSHDSETQICVPAKVFNNTKKRMVSCEQFMLLNTLDCKNRLYFSFFR